jgi:hypothetical protein
MGNEREPDVGQMWRQQPHAGHTMSLDEIRTKARNFDRKVKQWRDVTTLMFALLIVKTAWEVWVDVDVAERAGDALILAALLYVVYRYAGFARAKTIAATLGQTNCLEHYRAQLLRQRELSSHGWTFVLPFVPAVGVMVFARALQGRPTWQLTVMIVLMVVLFVGVIWAVARNRGKLEREIAALDGE